MKNALDSKTAKASGLELQLELGQPCGREVFDSAALGMARRQRRQSAV